MTRFLRWADEGYMTAHGDVFDMGIATQQTLVKYAKGTPPLECDGVADIPEGWLSVLAKQNEIEALCQAFAQSL